MLKAAEKNSTMKQKRNKEEKKTKQKHKTRLQKNIKIYGRMRFCIFLLFLLKFF